MRILDVNYNELDKSELDLEHGSLQTTYVIIPDAKPIDNITKFAWDNSDYEEIKIYQPYEEVEYVSPQDDTDAMLVDLEFRLTMLELGEQTEEL